MGEPTNREASNTEYHGTTQGVVLLFFFLPFIFEMETKLHFSER